MISILEALEKYRIEVKKSGAHYVGFCPFHEDTKTPNLTIYHETNTFYCWACGATGDTITLIQKMEGCDLATARKLAGEDVRDLKILLLKLEHLSNKKHAPLNYNDKVNFLLSTQIRQFLYDHPKDKKKVFQVMRDLDDQLQETLNLEQAEQLIEKIAFKLK